MERCKNLRWKGLYIEAVWDPAVPHGNDRSFWCLHTGHCLGPDSKVAEWSVAKTFAGRDCTSKPCGIQRSRTVTIDRSGVCIRVIVLGPIVRSRMTTNAIPRVLVTSLCRCFQNNLGRGSTGIDSGCL